MDGSQDAGIHQIMLRRRGRSRTFTVLGSAIAHALASSVRTVVSPIEARLPPGVLTYRSGWPSLPPRRVLEEAKRRLPAHRGSIHVLDVEDFYAAVTPATVEGSLRRLGADREATAQLRSILEHVAEAGCPGLPIGPRESGVLANAVLLPVDQRLRDLGVPHIRWVDDIALPGRSDAVRAVGDTLASLGLRTNTAKCRPMDVGEFRRAWLGSAS